MKSWHELFPEHPPFKISVNVSSRQFSQPDLVEQIKGILSETGLEPSSLCLEITESVIMENPDTSFDMLMKLKDMNIQLYIDDFGTGYSSLSYLHKLPIQTLKIDRIFLKENRINKGDNTIINTIVAMAKGLNLNVIAEGVESQAQLDYLREIECCEAQGFLFGKPLPPDVISQLLIQEPYATPGPCNSTKGTHWHH